MNPNEVTLSALKRFCHHWWQNVWLSLVHSLNSMCKRYISIMVKDCDNTVDTIFDEGRIEWYIIRFLAKNRKIAKNLIFFMRSAWAITRRWKSATDLAIGTVSQRQGCPSRGGIWRKSDVGDGNNPRAKPRSNEQKLHTRRTRNGRVSKTKQSPILPEFLGVNAVDTRGESNHSYPRRSCRCESIVTTNCKKSAETIVAERWRVKQSKS